MEIFKLYGSVFLKSDEADKRLDKINKKGKDAGFTFKKMGKMAMVAGGVVAAGIAAGAGAITGLAIKTGEAADRLLDLNSITGMTTDSIQAWENATVQAGVSADAMTNASQNLTKSMDIITTTGGKGAEAIEALGMSVDQISAMTADERLNTLTEALAGVDDKTVRAKLGTDLFKSSWQEIAPVIDLGVKGMKEAKANANIISNDDLQKANEFRIAVDNMKKRLSVLGMELGVKFMPIAQKVFGWLEKAMPTIEKIIDKTFSIIGIAIEKAMPYLEQIYNFVKENLMPIFNQFGENIGENLPAIQETIDKVVAYIVENILPPLINIFSFIKDEVVPALVEVFKAWFPQIAHIIKSTWQVIKVVLDVLLATFNYVFPFIKDVVLTAFDTIKGIVSGALKTLGGLIDFVAGVFTGDWSRAWKGIGNIFVGIWDIIKSTVKGAINVIIDALNFFVKKANKIINKMNKVPKINLPNIPTIPKLAEGGTITGAGTVMVGEEGPEFLNLPKGASVVPLNKAGNGGITVNINGATVFGDEDADKLGDLLVDRLRMLGVT